MNEPDMCFIPHNYRCFLLDFRGTLMEVAPRPSLTARRVWLCDPSCPFHAWTVLVEALAMGARPSLVARFAAAWGVDDSSVQVYMQSLAANGALVFGLTRTPRGWLARPAEGPGADTEADGRCVAEGRGDTALEASASLCRLCGAASSLEGGVALMPPQANHPPPGVNPFVQGMADAAREGEPFKPPGDAFDPPATPESF